MDLTVTTRARHDRMVVDIGGEIDIYTAPALLGKFVELLDTGRPNIIVNLEGVRFIDSSGLSVLYGVLKRVRVLDGSMDLVCSHPRTLRLFRVTGLPKDFPVYDSVEDAIA